MNDLQPGDILTGNHSKRVMVLLRVEPCRIYYALHDGGGMEFRTTGIGEDYDPTLRSHWESFGWTVVY
jgi:hypothetical protein